MISQRDFNEITRRKYNKMVQRLKPCYWKTGKRAGQLRKAGYDLPFTLAEFRVWAMARIGFQAVKCFYCPRAIDILHFEPDHYIPLSYAPSVEMKKILALDNLRASCDECNRIKGEMLPEDFAHFLVFLDMLSILGRHDVLKRMKAGAMGIRLGHQLQTPTAKPTPRYIPPISQRSRNLDFEDF